MTDRAPRDAVVVGGGLAGALAALALARLGARIVMVEATPPQGGKPDGRSLAMSLASCRAFESLGLWPGLAGVAQPITTVHVSESGRFGMTRLGAGEMHVAALGQVIPAAALLETIEQAALAAGVERLRPAEVLDAPLGGDGLRAVEIRSENSRITIPARLLVVADGGGSELRAKLGIATRERRFGADALVATMTASHPQHGVAYERFTREGILALLPRAGDDVGVVWTMAEARAAEFAALTPEDFAARVAAAIGGRLGRLSPCTTIRRYPLAEIRAQRQTAERAVVVGNAAHALHPVAAQGFNLTVRDLATLAECAVASREDIGAREVLARYARQRRRDQARTRAFTGALRRAGEARSPLSGPARAAGLVALELLRPLAREFARQGMGFSARPLPALVRRVPL